MPEQSLRRLNPQVLEVGKRLPGPILNERGRPILRAGRPLREADLDLIRATMGSVIYAGDDWPEQYLLPAESTPKPEPGAAAEDGEKVIQVDELYAGVSLAADLYDHNGVLLLSSGLRVTPRWLDLLRERNITRLRAVHTQQQATEPGHSAPERVAELTERADRMLQQAAPVSFGRREAGDTRQRLPIQQLRSEVAAGIAAHAEAVECYGQIAEDLLKGKGNSAKEASSVITKFVQRTSVDGDLLALIINLEHSNDSYLFPHSVNVALLSMMTADELGLNERAIIDVGLGALLQDVGMLRVSDAIRLAPRVLTDMERHEVNRHPIHTLDILEKLKGLSCASVLAAYQAHERADGSGYPRQRKQMLIHPHARITGMVDVFAAMTCPRPYRNALSPYHTMETLLRQGAKNRFDGAVVRAFINRMSLFPIGSHVQLNDGTVGRVLRPNGATHTRPVLVMLNDDGTETDEVLDLGDADSLRVIRALPGPPDTLGITPTRVPIMPPPVGGTR